MMHAFIWTFEQFNYPLGLNNRQDEGVAYAFDKFFFISQQLKLIEDAVKKTTDCDQLRSILQGKWSAFWKVWGNFTPTVNTVTGNDGWGGGYYYNAIGRTSVFALDATDIGRLAGFPFNVSLSCGDQAGWINFWLSGQSRSTPCCLAVTCDQTSPDPVHIVPAGVKIDPAFR